MSLTWRVNLDVPRDWEKIETDIFSGPEGIIKLEPFVGPGANTYMACEWEANAHQDIYSTSPTLRWLPIMPQTHDPLGVPCLILSPDSGPSALILRNPLADERPSFLILRMETEFADQIAKSVRYRWKRVPTATLATKPPPNPPIDEIRLEVDHWQGLTIEEYSLFPSISNPSSSNLAYISRKIYLNRQDLRQPAPQTETPSAKKATVETGFRNEQSATFQTLVRLDGQLIYTFNELYFTNPTRFHGMYSDEDHWVMEMQGLLVVDGQIVNQDWGCQEIHSWSMLDGKPFYFCVNDGKTHLIYNGETMPMTYENVAHYGCCGLGVINVRSYEQIVSFWAERDGLWWFVDLGFFD